MAGKTFDHVCPACEKPFKGKKDQIACSNSCKFVLKKLTDEEKEQLKSLHWQGVSYKAIGKKLGISAATVCNYLKDCQKRTGIRGRERIYVFISPKGVACRVHSKEIMRFCEQHNLHYQCLRDLLAGRQNQHRGWTTPGSSAADRHPWNEQQHSAITQARLRRIKYLEKNRKQLERTEDVDAKIKRLKALLARG